MGLKLRNLTPQNVTIRTPERDINLAAETTEETTPRLAFNRLSFGSVEADLGEESSAPIPMFFPSKAILGLPDEAENVLLIVGEKIANDPITRFRGDLVYLGEAIVDGSGVQEAFDGLCPGVGLTLALRLVSDSNARKEAAADLLNELRRGHERAKAQEATQDEAKERGPEPTAESVKELEPEPTAA